MADIDCTVVRAWIYDVAKRYPALGHPRAALTHLDQAEKELEEMRRMRDVLKADVRQVLHANITLKDERDAARRELASCQLAVLSLKQRLGEP